MDLTQVIERCLRKDRVAQRLLYNSYKDNLYTIIYRITGNHDLSNDVLQEAFIYGFRNLSKLKERKHFHSWMKRICIRGAMSELQKTKDNVSYDSAEDHGYHQDSNIDIEYIEKAIQLLPEKCRVVFIMSEIEGFKHAEIAETLNISVGTSKSQLNYAKTKLKKSLKLLEI